MHFLSLIIPKRRVLVLLLFTLQLVPSFGGDGGGFFISSLSAQEKSKKAPNYTVVDGKGTYYVPKDGRMTASGERYYKANYTCAHRTLPFGTHLKVTNEKNQKSVVVKVTDRGPFGKGYVVDLSHAGAKAIDILRAGVVPVHLEVVPDSIPLGPVSLEVIPDSTIVRASDE